MTVRDSVARRMAGGPAFRIRADRILVEVDAPESISQQKEKFVSGESIGFQDRPVPNAVMSEVEDKLSEFDLSTTRLNNLGIVVAEATRLDNVLKKVAEYNGTVPQKTAERLRSLRERARDEQAKTFVGGVLPGNLNFGSKKTADVESRLRNILTDQSLENPLTEALSQLDGIARVQISHMPTTFGPRNLNVDVSQLDNLKDEVTDAVGLEDSSKSDLSDAVDKMGVPDAWETTRGEDVVVAVFDTAYCEEFFDSSRIIDTFSGDDVDSAFSAPDEGHGTMTAASAAGNKGEGAPFDGVAPEADLLLARLTNSDGEFSYTEEAWDWLVGHVRDLDKPVISNHSYGVPLCSANAMGLCESVSSDISTTISARDDHQAFFAAGNEAMYCGHRLSGVTNGINGANSQPENFAVGALRFDLKDAQKYSSHGLGTCTDKQSDPKPDVGSLIPDVVPYGCGVKDMSSGQGWSNGGTSEASPLTCGVAALVASVTGDARKETFMESLESTAELPRTTQVNVFRGHDARFGEGQVRAGKAVEKAVDME